MKVGDKVLIEVEVRKFNDFTFTDKYFFTHDRRKVITQLPIQEGRWMMVGSCFGSKMHRAFVIGKVEELFVTFDSCNGFARWKYAKEIPVKRIITLAEVAKLTGESIDEIEFEKL